MCGIGRRLVEARLPQNRLRCQCLTVRLVFNRVERYADCRFYACTDKEIPTVEATPSPYDRMFPDIVGKSVSQTSSKSPPTSLGSAKSMGSQAKSSGSPSPVSRLPKL
jgi:hypothetical protein